MIHRPEMLAREPRVPLCVPVVTIPDLSGCRSLNVSATGIALIGSSKEGTIFQAGTAISLELRLPGTQRLFNANARIQWLHTARRAGEHGRLILGTSFEGPLAAGARETLTHYLEEHRLHVLLALPSPAEEAIVARVLGAEVRLIVAPTVDAVRMHLASRRIAAMVVFGHDASSREIVELAYDDQALARGVHTLAEEPSPCVVWAGPAAPEDLLALHNQGRLFSSMTLPLDERTLLDRVQHAVSDYGARVELHRLGDLDRQSAVTHSSRSTSREPPAAKIIYQSPAMRDVLHLVDTVAPQNTPVLLVGETGTGKELMAHAVHERSRRHEDSFVARDCGGLTETLLESELFGHVRGAFTGAVSDHPGLFVVAHNGTVFLDEVQNVSPTLQAKLLRVLESGEVKPVGGTRARRVDVRVVAASNRDLWKEVRAGRYRADLYFRLSRFPIELPALRERREDIPTLTAHLLALVSASLGVTPPVVDEAAERALLAHDLAGQRARAQERARAGRVARGRRGCRARLPSAAPDRGVGQEDAGETALRSLAR